MDESMDIKYETLFVDENHRQIVEYENEQLNNSNTIAKEENPFNSDDNNIMFVEVNDERTINSENLNLSTTSKDLVLPETSTMALDKNYKVACKKFYEWTKSNSINSLSENNIMKYINYLKKELTTNSLIDHLTVLRTFIQVNYKIDINTYEKVDNLWNTIYDNQITMESSVESISYRQTMFTLEEIQKFLTDAPDYHYLHHKVFLIIGILGACRITFFRGITLDDFDDDGTKAVMNLKDTYQPALKKVITNGSYSLFKKYINRRPSNVDTNILFLYYSKGVCWHRAIGKDRFRQMTREIAKYLKLENPHKYEGKTIRSTSEALISKFGHKLTQLIQPNCNYEIPSVSSSSTAENILNENLSDIEILSDGNSNYSLTNDADGNTVESTSNTHSETIGNNNFNDKSETPNNIEQNTTLFVGVKDKSNDGHHNEIIFIDENGNDDNDYQSDVDTSDPLLRQNCAFSTKKLRESSSKMYEIKYNKFKEWMLFEKILDITQDVVLRYINIVRKKFAPATASQYVTSLRYTIKKYHSIDIFTYPLVQSLAKELHILWKNKMTNKLFSLNEIQAFLLNAPDSQFLLIKAVVVMCLTRPCTNSSYCKILINDLEDNGSEMKFIRKESLTKKSETISGKLYSIFKKYLSLRPTNIKTNQLFISYHNGHCRIGQPCERKVFDKMSKQVADYLKLPNPYEYGEKSIFYSAISLRRNCSAEELNNFNNKIFKTEATVLSAASLSSLPSSTSSSSLPSSTSSSSSAAITNNSQKRVLFVKPPSTLLARPTNICNDDDVLLVEPPSKTSTKVNDCNDDVIVIEPPSIPSTLSKASAPLKASTPSKAPAPLKASTPSKAPAPLKASTPSKAPAPLKASTPSKALAPLKASTPSQASTPIITKINNARFFIGVASTSSATSTSIKFPKNTDKNSQHVQIIPSKPAAQVQQSVSPTLQRSNNLINDANKPTAELFTSADNKTLYIEISNSKGMDVCVIQK